MIGDRGVLGIGGEQVELGARRVMVLGRGVNEVEGAPIDRHGSTREAALPEWMSLLSPGIGVT